MFILWKLEWLKLTSKREVVTALLNYNCFDYFFQVLFVNVNVWILLWVLTLFSALNISVNTTHLEILRQSRLKCKTRLKLIVGATFEKFLKPSAPPSSLSYILNVHSLIWVQTEVFFCLIICIVNKTCLET